MSEDARQCERVQNHRSTEPSNSINNPVGALLCCTCAWEVRWQEGVNAPGLVDVGRPFWCSRQCRVTVPARTSLTR